MTIREILAANNVTIDEKLHVAFQRQGLLAGTWAVFPVERVDIVDGKFCFIFNNDTFATHAKLDQKQILSAISTLTGMLATIDDK